MRLVFMGTPEFACVVFEQLCERYEVGVVCTQPDKPIGRKQILTPSPIKLAAQSRHIPVLQPQVLDDEVRQNLASYEPTMIIVVAYGKILPESILSLAPCINLHASILPLYRGASPIQQMILSDDREFGVSVMLMDSGLDSGDILAIAKIPRDSHANYAALSQILATLGAQTLCDVINRFSLIVPVPQDHSKATYCKKISKQDGLVDLSSAQLVYKKWLAFGSWPGVFLASGVKLFGIELLEREVLESSTHKQNLAQRPLAKPALCAGEICSISPCIIACGDGARLLIKELQAPSKNRVEAGVFLRTRGLRVGDVLC